MAYVPSDDNRKFTELYNVQRLKSSYVAKDGQVLSVGLAFHSIEEAVAKASSLIPQGITWDDHVHELTIHLNFTPPLGKPI